MAISTRQMLGLITTVVIVGGTVYCIKKAYDTKKQEASAISLDEAKKIVEDRKADIEYVETHAYWQTKGVFPTISEDEMEDTKFGARDISHYDPDFERRKVESSKDMIEGIREDAAATAYPKHSSYELKPKEMAVLVDGARESADWNASFEPPKTAIDSDRQIFGVRVEDIVEEEEEEEEEEDIDPEELQVSKGYFEEDKDVIDDLRYEPNSVDAREQFISMELANLGRDNDTRDIVAMLYDHSFVPTCTEDHNLMVRLIDHRIKFFGVVSRWTKEVTYGDLIMYYGKSAEFNCGNDVKYWVDYFLTCADMDNVTLTSEEIDDRINLLNSHTFYNKEMQSHGLFGLTEDQMTEAIDIALKRIDKQVTYDIEFHQLMQGVIS